MFAPIEEATLRGAVKLSSFTETPKETKEEYTTTDAVEVPTPEVVMEMDIPMEAPPMDVSLESVELDFAPEIAGTAPVGGVPQVAAMPAQPQAAPSGGALSLGQVDEMPRALYAPPPPYPVDAPKKRKVTVKIRILISSDGKVVKATPINPTPEQEKFFRSAIDTVLLWEFTPCMKNGNAVQCFADQPFVFSKR